MTREEAKEKAIAQLERVSRNLGSIGEEEDWTDYIIQELEQDTVSKESYDHEYFLRRKMETQIDHLNKYISKLETQIVEQESTIKALGEELRKARKGIADEKVLIGYNLAVAICNKHLGGSEVEE